MKRIDEIKERSKTDVHTEQTWDDIAYLLRIAEAAEVMRKALEYYADESKWCGGFTIPSGKSISAVAIPTANANITYSYVTGDNGKIGREALAKVKELMGE